jgi:pilus assembly protein CpaB
MNTKKIWLLAFVFGSVMSFLFFIITTNNGNTNQTVESIPTSPEEEVGNLEQGDTGEMNILNVEPGMRAISIPVDEIQSVSGFIRPGSYVDIVSILPVPITEGTTSQIIFDRVKVLAVGKTIIVDENDAQEPYQMITLEVSPAEGARLAFVDQVGTYTLMLRGDEDKEPSPDVSISLEQLKGTMTE